MANFIFIDEKRLIPIASVIEIKKDKGEGRWVITTARESINVYSEYGFMGLLKSEIWNVKSI